MLETWDASVLRLSELSLSYEVNDQWTPSLVLSSNQSTIDKYTTKEGITTGNLGSPGQNSTNMVLVKEGTRIVTVRSIYSTCLLHISKRGQSKREPLKLIISRNPNRRLWNRFLRKLQTRKLKSCAKSKNYLIS